MNFLDNDGNITGSLEFSQIETILTDPQNEDPDARDDFVTVDEDDSVLIAPLANDTDPDGDPLEIVDFTDPNPPPDLLRPGVIGFQTYGADGHAGWVLFRNIHVTKLSSSEE